jgi:hypothetical protein
MGRLLGTIKEWGAVILLSVLLLLMIAAFVVCLVFMIKDVCSTLCFFGCIGAMAIAGVTWPQLLVEIRYRRAK